MRVALTQETNLPFSQTQSIIELSSFLEDYFEGLYYGVDVNQVIIGIICVKPEFKNFFKERKLKYIKEESFKNDLGEIIKIKNSVSYDIKLDYKTCSNYDSNGLQKLVAYEILKSIQKLDLFPIKIKNFDKDRFNADLENFFKNKNLI